jgi:hypothetical protein
MARDDNRDGIGPTRLRHCPRRLWPIDRLRYIEISAGRSGRNREKLFPNLALEIGAAQIQRERFVETAPTDSFLNGIERRPQPNIVARYFRLWKARAKVLLSPRVGLPQTDSTEAFVSRRDKHTPKRARASSEPDFHSGSPIDL